MVVLVAVVVAFSLLPRPDLARLREWSAALGAWMPIAFFVAYAVVTVAPVPRSLFTYSAAVLFAPALAVPLCLVATGCAAALAFAGVRHLGRERTAALREDPRIARTDHHLRRRGWVAVLCLRMVPAVPFSVLNYAAALTAIPMRQFLPATVVGSAPGTVAAICLGDALTSGSGAGALWATAAFATVGLVGLVVDARLPVRDPVSRRAR